MADDKKWSLAQAKFDAFRAHLPNSLDEEAVAQFHPIVRLLEEASAEDLDGFQIPETEMKQRVISVRPAAYGRPGSGRTNMSDKKYCDQKFMQMQIEGISRYFQSVEAINKTTTTAGHNPTDYWSMNDTELETLARKYNIPPWSRTGAGCTAQFRASVTGHQDANRLERPAR